jgi:hypothetical protein
MFLAQETIKLSPSGVFSKQTVGFAKDTSSQKIDRT